MNQDDRQVEEVKLLASIAKSLPRLEELWQEVNSHRGYEDPIYRFYHQSFKVFNLQEQTARIVEALQSLAPHRPLAPWFNQIVSEGAAEEFTPEVNERWPQATRPIVEAFFHARYFLEMVCKYVRELKEPTEILPSGWAAILCLYGLR